MPKPINASDLPIEHSHPAEDAWKKYKLSHKIEGSLTEAAFYAGWNAALAWIPFRIAQFREIEESLRKEIEELKWRIEDGA